jgi:plasmid stability protein
MANVTISLDDELLKKARVRAAEQGTSVNAVIRDQLEQWVGAGRVQTRAVASLIRRAESARSRRGNRRWSRDDLHER